MIRQIKRSNRNHLITCTCGLSVPRGFILRALPLFLCVLPAFFPVPFGLLHLDVGPPAAPPVVLPPGVQGGRSPVHRPLHVTEVGFAVLAGPVAPPPVLPVHVHLIVEAVVDLRGGEGGWGVSQDARDAYEQIKHGPTVIFVPLAALIRFMCLQNSGPWPSLSLLFCVTNSSAWIISWRSVWGGGQKDPNHIRQRKDPGSDDQSREELTSTRSFLGLSFRRGSLSLIEHRPPRPS